MFIFTVFCACVLLWVAVAICQFLQRGILGIAVPRSLARICGSKTCCVDPGLFSLQIFSILMFFWSIPIGLIIPSGAYLGFVFWRGVIFLLFTSFALFLFLTYLSRKSKS